LFAARVVGQNTHELGCYIGIAPLLLAVLALTNWRSQFLSRPAGSIRRFAVALVAVGCILAIGSHGPLQSVLSEVPLIGYFRFPCRSLVLVHFGLGLLAAIGLGLLLGAGRAARAERAESNLIPRRALLALNVASVVLAVGAPWLWPDYTAAGWLVWCGPALMLAASALILPAGSGSTAALFGIVVMSAIDLGMYGASYAAFRDVARLDDYAARTSPPPGSEGVRVAIDLAQPNGRNLRAGNQILLSGCKRIDGYAGLEPARSLDYRDINALRLAGVKFIAASSPVKDKSLLVNHSDGWNAITAPRPRVRVVREFTCTETPSQILADIDIDRTVMVEPKNEQAVAEHLRASQGESGAMGSARILIDRPGHIVVQVDSTLPSVLALTESFHRGWTAVAGDVTIGTVRINGDFLGCLAGAGRSTIEFLFSPVSLRAGRMTSVFGLSFLVMLIAASYLPRFRNPAACSRRR
jgi:hypothetical protein